MTEVKTISDTPVELKVAVEVSPTEYQKQFDGELSKIAKNAKLDGFRQGKVPLSVIKKKFESQCHQKSISSLIDLHSQKISLEKKLDVIGSPSAKLSEAPSNDKNLSFEVTYNIMPDIDLSLIKK